jgi:hypothetical protein
VRRAAAVGLLALLAACGSDDAPTLEAGGVDATSTSVSTASAPSSTTSTSAASGAEVETVELALTGDVGSADATLTYDGDELCLQGNAAVGPITGAHVHAAADDALVTDFAITTDGDGPFEGCVTVGAEVGVVLRDPTSYYVDVHCADGAVRAQLG